MLETGKFFNQDRTGEELIQIFDYDRVEIETLENLKKWEDNIRISIRYYFWGQETDLNSSRWFPVVLFCTRRVIGTQEQSYDTFIGKTLLNFYTFHELLLQLFQVIFGEWKKEKFLLIGTMQFNVGTT